MRKIKPFGCIVLVIALVMVFSGVASAYTPTSEDLEFIEWMEDIGETSMIYQELILSALEDYDYDDLESLSGDEYDHYKYALIEIDQYDVSPEMQPTKNEFKLALQDFKHAAHYRERGAKYLDSDDIDKSIIFSESGFEHLTKCSGMVIELTEHITPKDSDGDGVPDEHDYAPNDPNVQTKEDVKTPGFGVIFAIGSLLAVAYLVRRRKNE